MRTGNGRVGARVFDPLSTFEEPKTMRMVPADQEVLVFNKSMRVSRIVARSSESGRVG